MEEEARRMALAAEQERRRKMEEEARRRALEEEARQRAAAAAAEQQRWRLAEEARQKAAEDQRRRQQQQQAAWQQQKEEEQRRKQADQWAQMPSSHAPQHQQNFHWNQPHQQPGNRQQHHSKPSQPRQQSQSQQSSRAPPQSQQNSSPASKKYAAMASQQTNNGQASTTKLKHGILLQWALQPPQMQTLRSIDVLITTIHSVFPPAFGVPGHSYFQRWKPLQRSDIVGASGLPDDEKLKKSVRKIRFFLHPDKLPHDLTEDQKFMTKMLWDVTSDAWEEHEKKKEDMSWVRN